MTPLAPLPLAPEDAAFVRGLIIYEDGALLAFNKPAGLASQGGRGGQKTLEGLLAAFTRSNGKRPSLVHRLDRDTTGVILAAKTKPAASLLGKALMSRKVRKTYLALLARAPDPPSGRIATALRREEQGPQSYMRPCDDDHPDAEAAVTDYRTLAAGDGLALVELNPRTGRMHQLRAHLASVGRPILGDARYGGALTLRGDMVARVMLHALALEFPDPAGGRRRLTAPAAADFVRLATAAGVAAEVLAPRPDRSAAPDPGAPGPNTPVPNTPGPNTPAPKTPEADASSLDPPFHDLSRASQSGAAACPQGSGPGAASRREGSVPSVVGADAATPDAAPAGTAA